MGREDGEAEGGDTREITEVTQKFVTNKVARLESYLSYLQEYQNPMVTRAWPINTNFVGNNETVTDTVFLKSMRAESKGLVYNEWVRAGPRKQTYFAPSEVNVAIVACGGLDPGINIVVREITNTLHYGYNVKRAWGVRFGWRGFYDEAAKDWLELTQETVLHIHKEGGSVLGYSTDQCDVDKVLKVLEERGVNMLFLLGNVDACRDAHAIQMGAVARKMKLSVIMTPKSIENNFPFIDKCIGFDTIVQGAVEAIDKVLLAASSVQNGIGICKLGSGSMCLHAVLASGSADVCLLKAVPFEPRVVFEYISKVVQRKGYCIVVVEDGAGEDHVKKWVAKMVEGTEKRVPCGGSVDECVGKLPSPQYHHPESETKPAPAASTGTKDWGEFAAFDIGQFLKESIIAYFSGLSVPVTVRLSTPEWYIRSMPAMASDRIFCTVVASNVVHSAFAGFMDLVIGRVNQRYVYIPIESVLNPKHKPTITESSRMYNRMIRATGQPSFQRLGQAKLITGRGDVRRAFTPNEQLSELKNRGQ